MATAATNTEAVMLPTDKINALVARLEEIDHRLSQPIDRETVVKLSRERAELAPVYEAVRDLRKAQSEREGLEALRDDPELAALAESESAALVVAAENWMPGWQVVGATCNAAECTGGATLPGLAELEPVRANLTLIGILVAPGRTEFDLVYRPQSVRIGLAISAATVAVMLIVGAGMWLQRRW